MKYGNQARSYTVMILLAVFCIFGSVLEAQVSYERWDEARNQLVMNWQYAENVAINGSAYVNDAKMDTQGNSVYTGFFTGTVQFGSHQLVSYGGADIFVAKKNANGIWDWARKAGSTGGSSGYPEGERWEAGNAITVDESGNLYVVGSYAGAATFGTISQPYRGGLCDFFAAKLSPTGDWLWVSTGGSSGHDRGGDVSVNNQGEVFVSGTIYNTATFGSFTLSGVTFDDGFIGKLSTNGTWFWVRKPTSVSGAHDGTGQNTIDHEGNMIALFGVQSGTYTLGSIALGQIGSGDPIISKIGNAGIWIWARRYQGGSTNGIEIYDVVTDSNGSIYAVGRLTGTVTLGAQSYSSAGAEDILLMMLDSSGNLLWATNIGGNGTDIGWDITLDNDENPIVVAVFSGSLTIGNQTLSSNGDKDLIVISFDSLGNALKAKSAGGSGEDRSLSVQNLGIQGLAVWGTYYGSSASFETQTLNGASSFHNPFMALINFSDPVPPSIVQSINPISLLPGESQILDLTEYFSGQHMIMSYTFVDSSNSVIEISPSGVLTISAEVNWYGTEYITIRATNQWGLYVEQVLKVTVLQTWATIENFNNAGIIPTNWTTQHTGTTSYPWQPYQVSGTDYGMKTMAVTGTTANERLLSPTYNLSGYKEIEVSFDTAFLPYGSGTGTFAYTLNNVTYTTVETFSTTTSGVKTYTIPALDAKPSVRFRWNYVNGAANTGQENYWTVDNFRIFGLVRDVTAPTIVSGLEAMALTSTSATLQWNPSSDVYFDKYEIYISTDAQVTTTDQLWSVLNDAMLNNINTIQTTVSLLATGNYWAAIRAVDQSGNASVLSEVINFQIDGSAPVFSDPLPYNQPNPEWVNSLTATIGCTITDANQIDQNSIQYRIDANGNGIYDISEAWQAVTRAASYNIDRNSLNISVEVTYQVDGVLAYEFKAADLNGNIAYSGSSSIEGITDDWVLRLDTSAPAFSNPIPINQPNPTWTNNRTVTIGCSISDNLEIPLGSIEYRFDRNGNGNYDADEPWVLYSVQRQGRNSRNQILVSVEVLFEADGLLHFEFRAMDQVGNVGYSGTNNAEGMSDDWIVQIYATPPVFSNPIPGNQPNPNWSTTRTVTIGASVASFDSTTTSVYYRYDSNGNGLYDPDEAWAPINQRNGIRTIRDRSAVSTQITFSSDGIFAFEFKAEDSLGNIGYSGLNGVLGIDDDWVVKINSNPPQITNPTPSNQPSPDWQASRIINIEADIYSDVILNEDSIRFRYDQNKNGVYDPDELWQTPVVTSNVVTRQNQIVIQAEIQVSSDGVYRFEIKASDQNGLTGYSGIQHLEGIADDWVFRIDTLAPAAITNFFVEATTDNTIQLNWTASSDLNFLEYRVYYSLNPVVTTEDSMWCGADDPNLLASGSGLVTTTISGLIPSTRYYFMVFAIDAAGLSTHFPSVITAMTTSSTQPSSPQNVDLTVAGSILIIDWDDVTTDVLGNFIGISYYEVHVGDNPDFICSSESLISTVTESTLTLPDVVDYADRLFFKVIAVSGAIRTSE